MKIFKKALIFGISGQDGSLLAKFLIDKSYTVVGTTRSLTYINSSNLRTLNILDKIKIVTLNPGDSKSVLDLISAENPDEIYNLSGESSVAFSFDNPFETYKSIHDTTLYILESIRKYNINILFFNASSGDCFGETNSPAKETDRFYPQSPYALSKAAAFDLVAHYRKCYNLNACSGILFNHESLFRSDKFVTQKIVRTAASIKNNSKIKLQLGNLGISRDWGWANDYIHAMWLMLQNSQSEDFIIATGRTESLEYFLDHTFAFFNLNWREHTVIQSNFLRPFDIVFSAANPQKAQDILGWKANFDIDDIIYEMCSRIEYKL